jgi:O-antigen ligase
MFTKTPRKGRFSLAAPLVALGLVVFLAGWLAPNHYPPWVSFHGESPVFAALLVFSLVLLLKEKTLLLDRVAVLAMALIAVICLQWMAGLIGYSGEVIMGALYLGGFALAWLLGRNTATQAGVGEDLERWFAAVLLAAATLSVYIAVLQWLDLEDGYHNLVAGGSDVVRRPYGNLAQPNQLATLILMGVVMAVSLYQRGLLKLWQFWALLVWLSIGLTMAESRAGWLSALVLGGFLLWRGRVTGARLGGLRSVLAWWGLLLGLWLSWKPINEALLLTETRPVSDIVQDQGGRLLMWRQMLAGVEQSPWWGYGWRQTVAGHKAGTAQLSSGQLTEYAHNIALDLVLWLGLPLALLLMGVMAWWLLRMVSRICTSRELLLVGAALPVLVHSLVEFPFTYAYFLFTVAWLLGSVSALQDSNRQDVWLIASSTRRLIWAAVFAVYTSLCVWVALEYLQIEEDYRVLRFEMRKLGRTPEGYDAPQPVLLNQLGAVLRLGRLQPHAGMTMDELESMRVLNRNYNWSTLQMRYAVALALNGNLAQAKVEMEALRSHFGEKSYRQAKVFIQELQDEQYPQLAELQLP